VRSSQAATRPVSRRCSVARSWTPCSTNVTTMGWSWPGTSAGAAVMSSTMITAGDDVVATEGVQTAPGLEFLQGVLIDMHFAERGRLQRLLSAVALFPHQLGVGIDENTALLARGHQFDVLGTGAVTLVDAGSVAQLRVREDSQRTALTDVRLHILPAGSSFDLVHRRPAPRRPPRGGTQGGGA
jgi:cyanophycinase